MAKACKFVACRSVLRLGRQTTSSNGHNFYYRGLAALWKTQGDCHSGTRVADRNVSKSAWFFRSVSGFVKLWRAKGNDREYLLLNYASLSTALIHCRDMSKRLRGHDGWHFASCFLSRLWGEAKPLGRNSPRKKAVVVNPDSATCWLPLLIFVPSRSGRVILE